MIATAGLKRYNSNVSVSVITPSLLMFAEASASSLIKKRLPIRRGLFLLSTLTLYFLFDRVYTLLINSISKFL